MSKQSRTVLFFEQYFLYALIALMSVIVALTIENIPYANLFANEVSSIMILIVVTIFEKKFGINLFISTILLIGICALATLINQDFIAEIFGVVLFVNLVKGVIIGLKSHHA